MARELKLEKCPISILRPVMIVKCDDCGKYIILERDDILAETDCPVCGS